MEKDLQTTINDCLCPIENLSIENFCVLLAIIIVKASMKRCENLSEDEQKSNSEELFLKHLEIETELMWHIIPKNMMRGDQSFFLSLFSTSCGLVNTMIQPFQGKTCKVNSPTVSKEEIQENYSTLMSKDNTFATKGSLPLSSDTEASVSSSETKSSNILTSCVGRRSKRKKKKKPHLKSGCNETVTKLKHDITELDINKSMNNHVNDQENKKKIDSTVTKCSREVISNSTLTSDVSNKEDSTNVTDSQCGSMLPNNDNTITISSVSKDVRLVLARVLIPNEQSGSILTSFIPIINKCHHLNMGTRVRDVMAVVSFKQKVINPHEYAVYHLTFESKDATLENKKETAFPSDGIIISNSSLEDVFHGKFYIKTVMKD